MTILQKQALILMQALLGVISSNFRIVWVALENEIVIINIVLEKDLESDVEEIEDFKGEFEALQISNINYEVRVIVSSLDIDWPDPSTSIVVYKRRED